VICKPDPRANLSATRRQLITLRFKGLLQVFTAGATILVHPHFASAVGLADEDVLLVN
jgi:hypothetical protein